MSNDGSAVVSMDYYRSILASMSLYLASVDVKQNYSFITYKLKMFTPKEQCEPDWPGDKALGW